MKKLPLSVVFFAFIALITGGVLFGDESTEQVEAPDLSWQEAWRGVDEAIRLYEEGQFKEAADMFQLVRERAPEGELDVDSVKLIEGSARIQSGNPDQAQELLSSVEGFDEDSFRVRRRLLEGSAAYQLAQQALQQQDIQGATENAERAQERFRNALKEMPDNEDAAFNLEMTRTFLEEIPEPPPQENQEQQDQQDQQEEQEEQENEDSPNQESQDQESNPEEENQEDSEEEPEDSQEQQQSEESSEEQEQDAEDESQQQESQQDSDQQEESDQPEESEQQQGSSSEDQAEQEFSEEQARQLLENYDEQERRQRRQFLERRSRSIPVEKNW